MVFAVIEDDIEAVIPGLRAEAEAMMIDSCLIERQVGQVVDPDTLEAAPQWETVYSGRCRVQIPNASELFKLSGGAGWTLEPVVLQLPVVGSEDVTVGDRATITSAVLDRGLADDVLAIIALFSKTHSLSRRVACKEVEPS